MNIAGQIQVVHQHCIEDELSAHNVRQMVKADIGEDLPMVVSRCTEALRHYIQGSYYESKQRRIKLLLLSGIQPEDIVLEVLMVVLLIDGVRPIQNACAAIGKSLGFDDVFDGVKTAAELIAVLKDVGLFTLYKPGAHSTYMSIKPLYKLGDETLAILSKYKYLPPMICEPKPWTSNHYGGYLSSRKSVLLGKENHHEDTQALDALNIVQKVSFSLDLEVLKEQEQSSKQLDTPDKIANFTQQVKESQTVYQDLQDQGNKFWFVWRFDKRGRMYSSGYHVNLQSYEYKRALLNFTKKEVIE